MKDALDDEEWMTNLRDWRRAGTVAPEPIRLRVPEPDAAAVAAVATIAAIAEAGS
jgi:hypothetical protein